MIIFSEINTSLNFFLQNAESHMVNGYAEDLRQRLNYDPEPVQTQYQSKGSTVAITTNGDVVRTDDVGQASHGMLSDFVMKLLVDSLIQLFLVLVLHSTSSAVYRRSLGKNQKDSAVLYGIVIP